MTATYTGRNQIPFHPALRARRPERIRLLDAARGVWLPQTLATLFTARELRIAPPDHATLAAGPDTPSYWQVWQYVLHKARLTRQGHRWRLDETELGDLYLVEDNEDS